ncbi:hypothetical protein COX85_01540 [Candidatus Micrarchaeota archaeon CG_4_10_14_0_2_um_filter_55_9]|nr:MAG: hypothetical protein AUJ15_02315 [Candidatus Micrarchaeota archaeon CG1_02_55_41]PIO02671.1 MAG: hypothetical protein COT57_02805 [Candidatus Micrarchaeota archaeon CG09_land_8_20_14_0_10_55_25]PIZ91884.1 MAG: hypothetical protein COX85_01540 [Candidatus Micrarchaeota archaeon CG_4_10_14_0_2_um_filter_55_9]PJD01215.1 MAG: hypothetical protein COU38_02040 [Candidatus Micrarchaeota archaeon CG10_big_fil_rev_8_21_14_0_10_54_18]
MAKGIAYSLDAAMAAALILFLLLTAHSFASIQQDRLDASEDSSSRAAQAITYSENLVDGGGQSCVTRLTNGVEKTFCGPKD